MPTSTANPVNLLAQSVGEVPPEAVVFGRSEAMRSLRERLIKVAAANVPVPRAEVLEDMAIPNVERIKAACRKVMN